MAKIALVTNAQRRCGINGYAWSAYDCLSASTQHEYFVAESTWDQEHYEHKVQWLDALDADAIIYNHCPLTLGWLNDEVLSRVQRPQYVITGHDHLFQSNLPEHIFCIQSVSIVLAQTNPHAFYYTQWIPPSKKYSGLPHAVARRPGIEYAPPGDILQIGSFGIGTRGKNFHGLVDMVNSHFPSETVILNLHISKAIYKTYDPTQVQHIVDECRQRANPNVILNISSAEYMDDRMELTRWLNKNDINIFCDQDDVIRFAESTCTDHAMMARKPLGITSNSKFKHLHNIPKINIEHNHIKDIVAHGLAPLEPAYAKWNPETYCKAIEDYLKI